MLRLIHMEVPQITTHCDNESIVIAKDTLVYHFAESGILHEDMLMHRQNSTNRSNDMSELSELKENSIAVTFVSYKWHKLPKSTPQQMTDVGLCQRIT